MSNDLLEWLGNLRRKDNKAKKNFIREFLFQLETIRTNISRLSVPKTFFPFLSFDQTTDWRNDTTLLPTFVCLKSHLFLKQKKMRHSLQEII
jgi:hypothetical protein